MKQTVLLAALSVVLLGSAMADSPEDEKRYVVESVRRAVQILYGQEKFPGEEGSSEVAYAKNGSLSKLQGVCYAYFRYHGGLFARDYFDGRLEPKVTFTDAVVDEREFRKKLKEAGKKAAEALLLILQNPEDHFCEYDSTMFSLRNPMIIAEEIIRIFQKLPLDPQEAGTTAIAVRLEVLRYARDVVEKNRGQLKTSAEARARITALMSEDSFFRFEPMELGLSEEEGKLIRVVRSR